MSNLEQIGEQIEQLTRVITEKKEAGQNPKTELQWDEIEAKFGDLIEQRVEAQVQEKLAAQPDRRVPGNKIPLGGDDSQLKGNRYGAFIKSFGQGQSHKWGGQTYQPIDLWLAKQMMDGQIKAYSAQIGGPLTQPSDDLNNAVKALTAGGAGTGAELVPRDLAPQLWEDFFLASRVASTVTRVDMPTNPFDVPLGLGDVSWAKGAEATATSASDPATKKSTLTATELVTEQNWSYTLDEDAIIALAPALRARLAQSGGEIIDAFMLNADATATSTGNINLDDDTPDSASYYLSEGQDGIIHQWLVDNSGQAVDAQGATLTDSVIVQALGKLDKYAVSPDRLVMVTDAQTYLTGFLGKLDGVLTVDKFGPGAVLLTGQLASYRGVPVIVSASHGLAEADGKQSKTAASNSLGRISIYHRDMWYVGFRRDLLIEVDRDIQTRQYIMVTSLREAVAAHGTRATNYHTSGVYNIKL